MFGSRAARAVRSGPELSVPRATLRAMTALPLPPQRLPLTVADYVALGEDPEGVRYELQDGQPRDGGEPDPRAPDLHPRARWTSCAAQLPAGFDVIIDVDIDLQLVPPTRPGTVRRPDIVVVTRAGFERGDARRAASCAPPRSCWQSRSSPPARSGPTTRSSATSTPTPASRTTGSSTSASPATASRSPPTTSPASSATPIAGPVDGVFAATEPFPVRIDLDALV